MAEAQQIILLIWPTNSCFFNYLKDNNQLNIKNLKMVKKEMSFERNV